jgi:hypothetical protein
MNLYIYSIQRRAPAALPLAALCALLACAPPPAPAPVTPAPAPAPALLPATYGVSFVYEPQLTLRLQRDGQPYTGDAALTAPAVETKQALRSPLTFQGGQALITSATLALFASRSELTFEVEGQPVALPVTGSGHPFTCALSIDELRTVESCDAIPPQSGEPPGHCDLAGQRAWQKAREQLIERASACWASVDTATVERLHGLKYQPLIQYACGNLIEVTGKDPPTEQGVKLLPQCLPFFPLPARERLDEAHARLFKDEAFAAAQRGDSAHMRAFYLRYMAIAPEQAESIRKLAAKRFGPPDRARWLALRGLIEKQSEGVWRATLCEHNASLIEVAIERDAVPRYTERASAPERGLLGEMMPSPRRSPDYLTRTRLEARLTALLKARTGLAQVTIVGRCEHGQHWYLAR